MPALLVICCIATGAVVGALGHRELLRSADAELGSAGQYAAHHLEAGIVSRLRAMQAIATLEAPASQGHADRDLQGAAVASLGRLFPELAWIGIAEVPGRIAVTLSGGDVGADVSLRPWWQAVERGPYVGDGRVGVVADAATRAPALVLAVPLRTESGEWRGGLVATLEARWVVRVRDDLREVTTRVAGVEVLVLLGDDGTLTDRRVQLDPVRGDESPGAIRTGSIDGQPRVISLHPVAGDVVVERLGWRIAVSRDPDRHRHAARLFMGWALAIGAGIGLAGGFLVAGWPARR